MEMNTTKAWNPLLQCLRSCIRKKRQNSAAATANRLLYQELANLLWDDQVLGYGIAEKTESGAGTGELSARFYVKRKVSKSRLKSSWRIPESLQVLHGEGVKTRVKLKTDVVEMRSIPIAHRMLMPGQSIGHRVGTSGALGLIVDGNTSGRFLLSCAHVLSPPIAILRDQIESPADPDGVAGPNTVGELFYGMSFRNGGQFDMDAALVVPTAPNLELSNQSLGLGPNPDFDVITPANQMSFRGHGVRRFSFATPHDGVFDSIQNNVPVLLNNMSMRFNGVFAYRGDVRDGDSGSPVINLVTNRLLGLHFAGSQADRVGFVIPFQTIARRLKVHIAPI